MSTPVTIWNPKSTPIQISADGTQAPGLSTSVVDATDPMVKRLIDAGALVVLSGATKQAEQAIVVTTETPVEPVVEEPAAEEAAVETAEEVDEASESTEEVPKAAKSTRSKTQTAGKES